MARVYVELPVEWGPQRIVITAWTRAGYSVERQVLVATGEHRMLVNAKKPGA